uniref:T cell activation RhoGTPase activating protein b n=2 Tax=Erpetoichthys calabaricus TaxID=27687 RepID=A0A8C4SJ41_ERPCA
MKVLSGSSSTTKTLTGGCMDPYIEYDVEDAVKAYQPPARSDITDGTGRVIEGHKKRKKVLSWPFQRRSLTNSDTMRSDFDMKTPLFGQPLSIVCDEEEKLPKPIMDILWNLLKKGINTEGIFRKAGNVKVFKEIKEHLNAGTEIDLDEKPVILLAAVLKDFLRQIPNSLLLTELYESWMAAMEKESVSNRYNELKQVVDKLPRPNIVFLEHFLCLLYHITKKSEINKMDAKNLAVCIAPNMLQLNPKVSLEVQKEMTEKVTILTQFLIENCCEIFGENILSLLEEEELADSSDTLSSHQHDSAYDSTDADGDSSEQIRNIQSDLACSENTDLEERMSSQSFSSDALPTSLDSVKTFSHRYNRRCSEPDILASSHKHEVEIKSEKLARSHEDCSAERDDDLTFKDQNLKKQNSDDCVIKQRFKDKRPPNLSTCLQDDLGRSSSSKASSTCSLESTASSASVNSVFTSSPLQSPASPKRFFFARHQSFSFKSNGESQKNEKEVKKHSLSFSVRNDKKPLLKAKSWGPSHFNKSTSKKDTQKEGQFGCDTLQEDSQNEVEPCQPHPRNFLSPTEVFQQVDKKLPGRPPSYEQAIQTRVIPAPPDYKSMTVQDARRRLSSTSSSDKKSRPSSFTEALLYRRSNDSSPYLQEEDQTQQEYRKRTMSESKSRHERISHPLFEETFLVKESYV